MATSSASAHSQSTHDASSSRDLSSPQALSTTTTTTIMTTTETRPNATTAFEMEENDAASNTVSSHPPFSNTTTASATITAVTTSTPSAVTPLRSLPRTVIFQTPSNFPTSLPPTISSSTLPSALSSTLSSSSLSTQTSTSVPTSLSTSSKSSLMVADEPIDSMPNIMKANQLTSLVHRNIPPQEQQHCHRSALLKTILAAGNGGTGVHVNSSSNNNLNHHHNNHETKFEMNFSNGKLGLSSISMGNNNNSQSYGNNNNNTISINNNASTTMNNISSNNNNNNAPLDLSIDAAIKEVVSKDEKEIPVTSITKLSHLPSHHHLNHQPLGGGGGSGGGGEPPRRLNANQSLTPARFPSATNSLNNNYNKDSFGDKTNFSNFKQRGEEPQPSPLPASGQPTTAASPVHTAIHPQQQQQQQQQVPFYPSTTTTTTTPSTLGSQPSPSLSILPRNNFPTSHLQQQQQQQQLKTSSDFVKSSSSLSSTSLSLASFHKDVQGKSAMDGSSGSSSDQVATAAAAVAAAQKRQRGSKLSDHGRVRRKRQTLQEMARPLKEWMETHLDNPYPSKGEKQSLAQASNMTLVQVANWFANARRRLKIAEGKSGGDLAAKLAAISQSDHPIDRIEQMDVDEEMEDGEGNLSEGEGELTIDLGRKPSTLPPPQTDLDPSISRRECGPMAAPEGDRLHLPQQQQQQQQQPQRNNNNSILQRYLNELPAPESEAAHNGNNASTHKMEPETPSDSTNAGVGNGALPASAPSRWLPDANAGKLQQEFGSQHLSGAKAITAHAAKSTHPPPQKSFADAANSPSAPFAVGPMAATPSSSSSNYHHRRSPGPSHRRSPGMGSVSSHDFEDCGQASSETSSTSGPLDWTFNGSAGADHGLRSSPSPPKSGYELFDEMNAIEIDAALALVALSRMRQNEKLQRQRATTPSTTSTSIAPARQNDDAGVTTLSFANRGDANHGATIRVRQKH